ncbi:hypothetical protein A2V49_03465 [candidate division WWE3 bacterium RBG_19FT_COMBO_34_6]|uniref:Low affinity iron permease family protein n=1 Tax=candidate division WWE3 bacterium RBG_19FT_COMBO_34_6 TaxID=1802612 RepID=A0A1F4UKI2_UNCKA|nr:MAG: hypothetical protein A2V49_03465 [candidate division WWE3 bacterium RBG_19FT_COMBO_34_6]
MKDIILKTKKNRITRKFQAFADFIDKIVGSPYWFALSVLVVILWFLSGFIVGFGQTWQLVINTTTTILTFLMLSLLHSSQQKWEEKIEKLESLEALKIKEIEEEIDDSDNDINKNEDINKN